ncbi:hypothetical protein Zmor_024579 [Zophobas morio]|uniref:Ankyrin repeat-containing protein n=1 Tax=Zophobas morio TaxID=2755281 RepID=A0AA38M7V7_9CUCU|nr:hypothetical protein Zmor_024579 [Zophobas morio]
MSSSDSEDSYNYDHYHLGVYAYEGPPLIKKKSRLIAAVVQNQADILRDLLDSPKWYNVRDALGYNLLQIAILRDNIEVFDYMLSIPNFPLEFVNKEGQTALVVALDGFVNNDVWMREHFAYELIKKGACINKICFNDNTPLHCALERCYYKAAKLLIQRGADVNLINCDDCTPLDLALLMSNNITEIVTILLVYGAQPTVSHFERSVLYNSSFEVPECLFLYLYDQYSDLELRLDVLLILAEAKAPLFYHIIECPIKITIHYQSLGLYFRLLSSMSMDCLHLVIRKFGHFINKAFSSGRFSGTVYVYYHDKAICLENLNVMLKSELRPTVITFINSVNSSEIFQDLIGLGCDEKTITELYCYLLSYGLNLGELDLQIIYKKFGYCELFKILLHMDVQMSIRWRYTKNVVPVFVYDINMNLERFFQDHTNYCVNSINELRRYFSHPKLNEICCHNHATGGYSAEQDFQKIPRLIELARNIFRKFFIKKFKIKTCTEFYSRLNGLPISNIHKKIITYETTLY